MREYIGCLSAHVVAGEIDLAAAEMLDQRGDIRSDSLLVVAVGRPFGQADSTKIGCDDRETLGQPRRDAVPGIPGLRPAMQQHQNRLPAVT